MEMRKRRSGRRVRKSCPAASANALAPLLNCASKCPPSRARIPSCASAAGSSWLVSAGLPLHRIKRPTAAHFTRELGKLDPQDLTEERVGADHRPQPRNGKEPCLNAQELDVDSVNSRSTHDTVLRPIGQLSSRTSLGSAPWLGVSLARQSAMQTGASRYAKANGPKRRRLVVGDGSRVAAFLRAPRPEQIGAETRPAVPREDELFSLQWPSGMCPSHSLQYARGLLRPRDRTIS